MMKIKENHNYYTNIAEFLLRNTNQRETNISAIFPADLIGGLSALSSIGEGKFSGNDVGMLITMTMTMIKR